MGTYTSLSDAIFAQVNAVPNIGQGYQYLRYVADWANFKDLYKFEYAADKFQVRGFWLTLQNPAMTVEVSEFHIRDRIYHFLLTLAVSLQDADATERTLIDLVELVIDTLDNETTFGVSGVIVRSFNPICRVVEQRQFGSVLCNVAEIAIDIPVEKAIT